MQATEKANCIIPTGQNLQNIEDDFRALLPTIINKSKQEITPEQTEINIKSDTLSTHGFGLAEVIKLFPELEISTKLIIIGIQPKDISFGEGLSAEITSKINAIIDLVQQQISNWGQH